MKKKTTALLIILGSVSMNNHIPNNNGASTEVVLLDPESFDCETFEYYSMVTSNNNYGRGTDVQLIYKECDYDNVNYSFGKISGVKMLKCTKCNALSGVVDLQILSELNEGNLEIAIYMNDNFIKNVNNNSAENESIPYEKNDVIKVVAFCESAKCSVSVVRTVK